MSEFDDYIASKQAATAPVDQEPSFDSYIAQKEAQKAKIANMSEFSKGVGAGVDSFQGLFGYGIPGAIGEKLGIDSLRDWGAEGMQRNEQEAQQYTPKVGQWKDVHGLGDFGNYMAYQTGNFVPSIGESLGAAIVGGALGGAETGGVGAIPGAIGGFLLKNQLKKNVAEALAKKSVVPSMERYAAAQLANKKIAGAAGATALNAYGTGVGDIYQSVSDSGRDKNASSTSAFIGAVPYAALEYIGDMNLAKLVGIGGPPAKEISKSLLGTSVKQGLKQSAIEGTTEASQQGLISGAMALHDPTSITLDKAIDDSIESFWAAAVGSLIPGLAGGAKHHFNSQPAPAPAAPPAPSVGSEQATGTDQAAPATDIGSQPHVQALNILSRQSVENPNEYAKAPKAESYYNAYKTQIDSATSNAQPASPEELNHSLYGAQVAHVNSTGNNVGDHIAYVPSEKETEANSEKRQNDVGGDKNPIVAHYAFSDEKEANGLKTKINKIAKNTARVVPTANPDGSKTYTVQITNPAAAGEAIHARNLDINGLKGGSGLNQGAAVAIASGAVQTPTGDYTYTNPAGQTFHISKQRMEKIQAEAANQTSGAHEAVAKQAYDKLGQTAAAKKTAQEQAKAQKEAEKQQKAADKAAAKEAAAVATVQKEQAKTAAINAVMATDPTHTPETAAKVVQKVITRAKKVEGTSVTPDAAVSSMIASEKEGDKKKAMQAAWDAHKAEMAKTPAPAPAPAPAPVQEAPKQEAQKQEAPKQEAPKQEANHLVKNKSTRDKVNKLAEDGHLSAMETSGHTQHVVDFHDRKMVVVNVNGHPVLFYLSTGRGGKKDVASGKWYPVFGISDSGWINKLGGADINNYYGSKELADAAKMLDSTLGDISKEDTVNVVDDKEFISKLNSQIGLTATENGTPTTKADVQKNIDLVKQKTTKQEAPKVDHAEQRRKQDIAKAEQKKRKELLDAHELLKAMEAGEIHGDKLVYTHQGKKYSIPMKNEAALLASMRSIAAELKAAGIRQTDAIVAPTTEAQRAEKAMAEIAGDIAAARNMFPYLKNLPVKTRATKEAGSEHTLVLDAIRKVVTLPIGSDEFVRVLAQIDHIANGILRTGEASDGEVSAAKKFLADPKFANIAGVKEALEEAADLARKQERQDNRTPESEAKIETKRTGTNGTTLFMVRDGYGNLKEVYVRDKDDKVTDLKVIDPRETNSEVMARAMSMDAFFPLNPTGQEAEKFNAENKKQEEARKAKEKGKAAEKRTKPEEQPGEVEHKNPEEAEPVSGGKPTAESVKQKQEEARQQAERDAAERRVRALDAKWENSYDQDEFEKYLKGDRKTEGGSENALQLLALSSKNPVYRAIAKLALKVFKDHFPAIRVVGLPEMEQYVKENKRTVKPVQIGGYYDPKTHTITLNKDNSFGGLLPRVFVHEMAHAMTRWALNPNNHKLLNATQKSAVMKLVAIYDHVSKISDFPKEMQYAIKNVDEMVAEAFGNPDFQRYLARIPSSDTGTYNVAKTFKSAFDEFVGAIQRFLGIPTAQNNLLNDLLMAAGAISTDRHDANGDIILSVDEAGTAKQVFDGTSSVMDSINSIWNKATDADWEGLKDSAFKTALGWYSMNHIQRTFAHKFPWIKNYIDAKNRVKAEASRLNHEASELDADYARWTKSQSAKATAKIAFEYEGEKINGTNVQLAEALQSAITIYQVDPTKKLEDQKGFDANSADLPARIEDYNAVRSLYDALTKEGRDLVIRKLRMNQDRSNQLFEARVRNIISTLANDDFKHYAEDYSKHVDELVTLIMDQDIAGKEASKQIRDLVKRQKTESETYFHVGRFGPYFLRYKVENGTDKDGNPTYQEHFMRFDTRKDLDEASEKLMEVRPEIKADPEKYGFQAALIAEHIEALDKNTSEFIKSMMARLESKDLTDEERSKMRAMMRELYIQMLPETAPDRVYVRRRNVPGYKDSEQHRAWAKRILMANYQIARMKNAVSIQKQLEAMEAKIVELQKTATTQKGRSESIRGRMVMDEIRLRAANEIAGNNTPEWVNGLNQFAYISFLGLSPSYFLLNSLQPMQLSHPLLGSRFGYVKSAKAMSKSFLVATKLVKAMAKGKFTRPYIDLLNPDGSISPEAKQIGLTPNEARFLQTMLDSGRIDITQAFEIGRTARDNAGPISAKIAAAGIMTHYGEIINRVTAGLTAYRLERERSDDNKATEYAGDLVDRTQFDYSQQNLARLMSKDGVFGKMTPLAMGFQRYTAQLLELWAQTVHDSLPGAFEHITDKAEREQAIKESRKALAYLLTNTAMIAGTMGLPFASVIFAIVSKLKGDDDDPDDSKQDYKEFLKDIFGKEGGDIVAHGGFRAVGFDISARAGMQDLMPFSKFLTDRRKWQDSIDDLAVESWGPAVGGIITLLQAIDANNAGYPALKVLEQAAPNAVKGVMKAMEAYDNGYVIDAKGNKIPYEYSGADYAFQSLGLNPTGLAQRRENLYSYNTIKMLKDRRKSDLTREVHQAIDSGDREKIDRAWAKVDAYNAKQEIPADRLKRQEIMQSKRRKEREFNYGLESGTGIPIAPKYGERTKRYE